MWKSQRKSRNYHRGRIVGLLLAASHRGEYMFEFEINRCSGCSLKEVLEFKEWTNSQLEEIWKLSVGDGVNLQGQLIRRVK